MITRGGDKPIVDLPGVKTEVCTLIENTRGRIKEAPLLYFRMVLAILIMVISVSQIMTSGRYILCLAKVCMRSQIRGYNI